MSFGHDASLCVDWVGGLGSCWILISILTLMRTVVCPFKPASRSVVAGGQVSGSYIASLLDMLKQVVVSSRSICHHVCFQIFGSDEMSTRHKEKNSTGA